MNKNNIIYINCNFLIKRLKHLKNIFGMVKGFSHNLWKIDWSRPYFIVSGQNKRLRLATPPASTVETALNFLRRTTNKAYVLFLPKTNNLLIWPLKHCNRISHIPVTVVLSSGRETFFIPRGLGIRIHYNPLVFEGFCSRSVRSYRSGSDLYITKSLTSIVLPSLSFPC